MTCSQECKNSVDTMCMPPGVALPVTAVQNMGFSGRDIGGEPRALHHVMASFLTQKRVSGVNHSRGFSSSVGRSGSWRAWRILEDASTPDSRTPYQR